jgi:uncharacterized protein (TIGR02594 family)
MSEPAWLALARTHVGTREIPGPQHEPKILSWWKAIRRSGIKTDEVPWCAAFVGAMLETVQTASTRFESARSYLNWGSDLGEPAFGCVVVLERGPTGGHVGFVVGEDKQGRLIVLGGNQDNAVGYAAFKKSRVLGYRWPAGLTVTRGPLPQVEAPTSKSEA